MEQFIVELKISSIDDDFRTWLCHSEGFVDGHGGNEEEALGDWVWKNRKRMVFKIKKDKIEFTS